MDIQKCDDSIKEKIGSAGDRRYRGIDAFISVSGDVQAYADRLIARGIVVYVAEHGNIWAKVSVDDLDGITDAECVLHVDGSSPFCP